MRKGGLSMRSHKGRNLWISMTVETLRLNEAGLDTITPITALSYGGGALTV